MPPKFIYFDLGKVLVDFSVERMCRQMGQVAGVDADRVAEVVFEGKLQEQSETGQITDREFHEAFCERTDTRPDFDALKQAGSDIFDLNPTMLPLIAHLLRTGHRLGVLSNTCQSHWEHCRNRYHVIGDAFEVHALSFRVKAAKPSAEMFLAAAELAGVQPGELFFTDDTPGHVAGAQAAGFDAVRFTSASQIAAELHKRGVAFNY